MGEEHFLREDPLRLTLHETDSSIPEEIEEENFEENSDEFEKEFGRLEEPPRHAFGQIFDLHEKLDQHVDLEIESGESIRVVTQQEKENGVEELVEVEQPHEVEEFDEIREVGEQLSEAQQLNDAKASEISETHEFNGSPEVCAPQNGKV